MSHPSLLTRDATAVSNDFPPNRAYETISQPPLYSSSSSSSSSASTSLSSTFQGSPNFKIILVGDAGVGKTSLFNMARHPTNDVTEGGGAAMTSASTVGVDVCTRSFLTRYGKVTLTMWDTAGVERYRTLTRNYYRNTHAAVLVCSVDDQSTLFSLPRWLRDVIESAPSAVLFLVGNKSDLLCQEVTEDSMQSFADCHSCQAAFLTSAKTGNGVDSALLAVAEHLAERYRNHKDMTARETQWGLGSGLQVHNAGQPNNGKCCT